VVSEGLGVRLMMLFMASVSRPFLGLVLVGVFLEDLWGAHAPFRWQVAGVAHHVPHLLVCKDALPGGHAAETDAVFNNPFQLPVAVRLHRIGGEVGYGGRHSVGKRNARILAIQAVAELTVRPEVLGAAPCRRAFDFLDYPA
jgi:hypothetical protein